MSARSAIENLTNGNVCDARDQAKRLTWHALYQCAQDEFGFSMGRCTFTADYLKGKIEWARYCVLSARCNQAARTMPDAPTHSTGAEVAAAQPQATEPDPAAVYGIAASLDAFAHSSANRGNISAAYEGADQFMREIMRIGAAFETWASAHIDFDELDDVWPYMLQDKFGDALERANPGAILILDKLTDEVWPEVAHELGLTMIAKGGRKS